MTSAFVHESLGGRVVFGPGRRTELAAEVDALEIRRAMVIADAAAASVADGLVGLLGSRVALRWDDVAQHVPAALAGAARTAARSARADGIVCIGGGSATGLAKAVALVLDVPILAVPTTYAGSEVTPIYGITGEHKETGRDPRVLPRVVIYDPELTVALRPAVTATSAFNAMAHAVEALYGQGASPITSLLAEESIRVIADALPHVVAHPGDVARRGDLLYGAYLAGSALAVVGMALHHRVCHVLGGTFGLVHGDVNAVVLPHVVAFNGPAAPEAIARVARALGVEAPAAALFDLARATGAPTALAALGLPEADLARAAALAAADTTSNPCPVQADDVLALLTDAWHGRRPPTA